MELIELQSQRFDIGRAAILRRAVWDGTDNLFDSFVHVGNSEGAIDVQINPEYSELTLPESSGPAAIKRFLAGGSPEFEMGIFPTEVGLALFSPTARGAAGQQRRRVAREHTLWIVPEELFLKADVDGNMTEVPITYVGGAFLKDGLALTVAEQELVDLSIIIWRADFSRSTPLYKHDEGGKSLRSVGVKVQQDFTKPSGAQLYLVMGELAEFPEIEPVAELPSYDLLWADYDGHSNLDLSTAPAGGQTRYSASELLPQMLDISTDGINHAASGKTIGQMRTQFPGYSRPAQPAGTLKVLVVMEAVNEPVLADNHDLDDIITRFEDYILLAVDTAFYDHIFVFTPTPAGYDNWWANIGVPLGDYFRAGVVVDSGRAGHAVGSPLGITVLDVQSDPLFDIGGLRNGEEEGSSTPPDVTNVGGILSKEMATYADFSSTHVGTNGSFVFANYVRSALQAVADIPSKAPADIIIQHRPRGIGTAWTSGQPTVQLGFPLRIRAVARTAGVADPDFDRVSIWRDTNLDLDMGQDIAYNDGVDNLFRCDQGAAYTKAAGETAIIKARHGSVTATETVEVTAGTNVPFWIQRMRCGWGAHYASGPALELNDVYDETNIRGALQPGWLCKTDLGTGAMVVGDRVLEMIDVRDPASPLILTVPGGKVGPILRRMWWGPTYPHGPPAWWKYWLEFDSADAVLSSPAVEEFNLATVINLNACMVITHPETGDVSHAIKIHNAGDTEILAIECAGASPRVYFKTATQEGHVAIPAPIDRITGSPKRFYRLQKFESGADHIARMDVVIPFGGGAGTTADAVVNPGFTDEPKKLTIGGVGYMQFFGMFALRAEPAYPNDGWYNQNAAVAFGTDAGYAPPAAAGPVLEPPLDLGAGAQTITMLVGPDGQLGSTSGVDAFDPAFVAGPPVHFDCPAVDSYVTFGNVLGSTFQGKFTIRVPIESPTSTDFVCFVGKMGDATGTESVFWLIRYAGKLILAVFHAGDYARTSSYSSVATITDGQRYIAVVSYDDTLARADRGKVYLDGVDDTGAHASAGADGAVADTVAELRAGRTENLDPLSPDILHLFTVWPRILTPAEAASETTALDTALGGWIGS